MSVAGLCDVCESAQAVDRCDRCGASVCREHAAAGRGLCTECASETGPSGPGRTF